MIETLTQQKPLSLGFVGVGWIGRNRMEVLSQSGRASIKSIFEPAAENASEALKSAPDAALLPDLAKMYSDPEIDGIVIATPSAMHARQSIDALQAGKAVFCQKPLGRTAAEVRDVVAAAKKANKLLEVDLSYRFTKAFQEVRNLVSSGMIGAVYAVDLIFHNAYGPDKAWFYDIEKSGGGCVMDLGIHMIDMALLSLSFPKVTDVRSSLYSKGKLLTEPGVAVEDFAMAQMTTGNGTIINLQCSWHVSAGQDAVIQANFYGTEGGASFKNVNGSFYDFVAEKYHGTRKEVLVSPPDNWSGRAGVAWADRVMAGETFDPQTAEELIMTAEIIDRIYGRQV